MTDLPIRQPALIGRDAELSKLKQSLDNAVAGKGSTVFIAGEAGEH
jgi:predicted ATPase